ncbi:MAG TPA: repressor LexA, partial [Polyangiaceae bacterium]|nr:repressor LexA [Polyangiaceae bacterium]
MQGLTKRQEQTLDFIRRSIEDRGYPPTLREIGEHMGIRSTNGVNDHLRALERKGYLTREDMKSRALKLVEDQMASPAANNKVGSEEDLIEVRVLGRVAAG